MTPDHDTSKAPRLVLRTDGNAQIGLGHLVRSLALTEIVRPLFREVVLLTQNPILAVRELAAAAGIELLELPAQSSLAEAAQLPTYLRPTDVVVLDGYGFDAAYQARVKASGGRLVLIDDLKSGPTPAPDLIINQGPGVTPADYAAGPTTRFCLGSAFSLLRRPFREQARAPRPAPGAISSVLVCFGGADPLQLTRRALAALLILPQVMRVGVVTGSAFTAAAGLHWLAGEFSAKEIAFYHDLPAAELAALFQEYEAAVVPASTVLLEALVLGGAAITGYYVENQRALATYVHEHRQAFSVGDFTVLSETAWQSALLQGLEFHQSTLRQAYVERLAPEQLLAEFQRLIHL